MRVGHLDACTGEDKLDGHGRAAGEAKCISLPQRFPGEIPCYRYPPFPGIRTHKQELGPGPASCGCVVGVWKESMTYCSVRDCAKKCSSPAVAILLPKLLRQGRQHAEATCCMICPSKLLGRCKTKPNLGLVNSGIYRESEENNYCPFCFCFVHQASWQLIKIISRVALHCELCDPRSYLYVWDMHCGLQGSKEGRGSQTQGPFQLLEPPLPTRKQKQRICNNNIEYVLCSFSCKGAEINITFTNWEPEIDF